MVKRVWFVSLILSLGVGVGTALAQQRAVSGRVTSSVTAEPVGNASVSVVGTPVVTVTNERGEFSLLAPPGNVALRVRRIGFKSRTVPVPPSQASVDVRLDQDVFNLDAVVVTGQVTAVEQRNLPNAVAVVNAEQLVRAPVQTVEGSLQGKVPGALIQANSGAPGGGVQVNLRGVSTVIGRSTPLFVVDGIVVSDAAVPSGMNAVTAAQAGGNPNNQDDPVNRIADLTPTDIERVEILKGGSAAAIYGSKATNGVVIITTRRGQVGEPRFNFTQRFGVFDLAHKIGMRAWDPASAVATFGPSVAPMCTPTCPFFDLEEQLYGRNDLSTETVASVSGGTEQTRYYVSGLVKNDEGIAQNTGYQKQSLRLNLDQRLGGRVGVSVSSNVVHSRTLRGISNNDNSGTSPYLVFPFTPSFAPLSPTGGVFPDNPFERSNPLETMALLKNKEDVWRALGTATATLDALTTERHSLRFVATGGLDYFDQRNDFYSPPELQFEPQDQQPGTVVLGKASNVNLNLAGHAIHTYRPASGAFTATTSAGTQFEQRNLNLSTIVGRSLLPGQANVDLAASIPILAHEIQEVKDLGIFGQEEVLMLNERLLLTLGVRADRSSANGDTKKYFLYPKAAASYRFIQPTSGIEEFKLRAAWGQTGNQPLFGQKFIVDTTGSIDGREGTYAGQRIGNPNIKPERQTEFETGFDAAFTLPGLGPSNLAFTVYQKTISDLLLEQTLDPTFGQLSRVLNGGKLRNRGVEAALAFTPVQRTDFRWVFRTTFFANRSKFIDLPIPTFQFAGFGTSLGSFQIEEGKSATQIIGTEGAVGDANPDFQMSFSNDVDYDAWSLGFLLDWKKGGDVVNLTELLFDVLANTADYQAGTERFTRWVGGETKVYVQDASYLKLREVSLSYRLPGSVTHSLFGRGAEAARVSFSGRNLLRFTPYRGLDPEVSNFGFQAIARNIDVAPFPPSRSFFLSIDVTF